MKQPIRLAVLAGLALALSACGLFGSDAPRKIEPTPLQPVSNSLAVRPLWSVSLGSQAPVGFQPALVNDSAYAAASGGAVIRVELASGRVVWRIETGGPLSAGVGADASVVAVATPRGEVIALESSTGAQRWRMQASSQVVAPPAVGEGLVVVRTGDYRITAFDAASGERRWSIQRPGPGLALRAHAELLIADGLVYAGLPGGRLLAIQASTGVVRYESVVATPRGANELERIADVVGAPKRDGREVCAVSHQGRLACFDATSGAATWARDFSSSSGMALDPRFAFASSDIGVVQGFSRSGGVEAWRQDGLRYRRLSAPVSTGRAVAVGDFEGQVHFLDRDTGRLIARQATDGSAVLARPVATSAGVLLQTRQSTLWHIAAGQ